jgi:hypothetical protein
MSNAPRLAVILLSAMGLLAEARGAQGAADAAGHTVLGIEGTRFTINGRPTFLLGISYYAGLGASKEFVRSDLDDLQHHGFNWIRVWATWGAFGKDVSAVDVKGEAREPFLGNLKWLVSECDRRGMIVDVTLTRGKAKEGGHLPDMAAHRGAVEVIVKALKEHRNWYLDLANEHDVGDDRHVSTAQIKALREVAREIDPKVLVTASFGGHDLSQGELRDALQVARLDFVSPHRPREPDSPGQTRKRTEECLAAMKKIGRLAPVHYQEPLRRGYQNWEPKAEDFLTDLRGAVAGGAAGWCFHNGSQRGTPDERPRRSFDLSEKRLFDQLDAEEQKVVEGAAKAAGLGR